MSLPERLEALIGPTVDHMGYGIVRIMHAGGDKPLLQIMIERTDEGALSAEDCAKVSRAVSAVLDVEDPMSSAYTLEVSSPGIDRPLVKAQDFERFAGYEVRLETARLVDGRKRFRGHLVGLKDDEVHIDIEGRVYNVPFADIVRAKLVMTDELLAKARG